MSGSTLVHRRGKYQPYFVVAIKRKPIPTNVVELRVDLSNLDAPIPVPSELAADVSAAEFNEDVQTIVRKVRDLQQGVPWLTRCLGSWGISVAPEPNHLKGAIDAFNDNRLPGAGAARYTPRGITLSYYKEEVTVLTINQLFYGEGTKQDVATHRPAYPYECIRFTLPRPVRSPMTWETHGPIPRAPTPTTYVPANVDPDDAAAVEYAEAARRYEAAHGPPTAIAQKPKVGAPFGVVNIRQERG